MKRPLRLCSAPRHPAICLLFAALWVLPPGRTRACELRLEGEPSAAWREAVQELPPAPADDCSSLVLRAEGEVARLIFTTQDGRRAERVLTRPDELAASIAALRVTGPDDPSAGSSASTPAAQASDTQARPPRSREVDALGTLLGGVRLGDEALLSPTLGGSLLARIRDWELGALAGWETGYYALGSGGARRKSGAATTSLTFARRKPLGRFALLAGARLGMAVILRNSSERPAFSLTADTPGISFPTGSFYARRLQGRTGAFVGFSMPRAKLARVRCELGAELAWPRQFHPAFMFWAFTIAVGVELGRP